MKRINMIAVIAAGSFAMMLSFQNCSKVQTSEVNPADQKASSLGASDGSNSSSSTDSSSSSSSSDSGSKSGSSGSKGPSSGSDCSKSDDGANDLDKDSDYEAYCKGLGEKEDEAISAGDKSSFSNVSGNFFVKAAHLANLSDITGNIHLIGTATDSSIDSISNMHGNIIICGMDVKSVKASTTGHLVVVGGDIGQIDGFSGNIRVIGGKILGGITNSNGNLAGR
ncbi:MAG: hypothetical protein ACXVAX_07310 [Pseudobdellovibrio sp.]